MSNKVRSGGLLDKMTATTPFPFPVLKKVIFSFVIVHYFHVVCQIVSSDKIELLELDLPQTTCMSDLDWKILTQFFPLPSQKHSFHGFR